MTLATIHTRALIGINAPEVTVEVHLSNGLPAFSIVGLPEAAVRESKDRVRAAIINSHFEFPARKITVNLAPADLPKQGGRYDLSIALGILAASGQVNHKKLSDHEFYGELALSGQLRSIPGNLPVALANQAENRTLIFPTLSANEAALVDNVSIKGANDLLMVCRYLEDVGELVEPDRSLLVTEINSKPDMSDVRGQHHARRALEICAAGQHNLLMVGPPGTGKSMLASRLPSILPPLTDEQALESASIYSISRDGFDIKNWKQRPFRNPHHTASGIALVGGGSIPSPGEISLAHHGVLFLDELTEFKRHVLDVLREPLETGNINISRATQQATFPARFQLVAAMNPCPNGYSCDGKLNCQCTPLEQNKYLRRLSAPLLDRFDMQIEVPRLDYSALNPNQEHIEQSAQISKRVKDAHDIQLKRCGKSNAELGNREIEKFCALGDKQREILNRATQRLSLSARAYHKILKLARTIADLESSIPIELNHISEAITFRSLDRFNNL